MNLSLPEPEEEDESVAELHALALTQEIVSEVNTACLAEILAEQKANGKYALQNPSARLKAQLEEYRQHRTKVLNLHRVGGRVTDVTTGDLIAVPHSLELAEAEFALADSDVCTMLRFLGFVKNTCPPCELDFGIFRSDDPAALKIVQDFTDWLVDIRKVSYGTIAGAQTLFYTSGACLIRQMALWQGTAIPF